MMFVVRVAFAVIVLLYSAMGFLPCPRRRIRAGTATEKWPVSPRHHHPSYRGFEGRQGSQGMPPSGPSSPSEFEVIRSLVIVPDKAATEKKEGERENICEERVKAEIKDIVLQIENVELKIKDVELKIENVEGQIKDVQLKTNEQINGANLNSKVIDYLFEEKSQLREKEARLLEERRQLRDKEEGLRGDIRRLQLQNSIATGPVTFSELCRSCKPFLCLWPHV
jgi:hypothetical protein